MKIEKIPEDDLFLHEHIGTAEVKKEKINISISGSSLIFSFGNGERYEVDIGSIIQDVLKFRKNENKRNRG